MRPCIATASLAALEIFLSRPADTGIGWLTGAMIGHGGFSRNLGPEESADICDNAAGTPRKEKGDGTRLTGEERENGNACFYHAEADAVDRRLEWRDREAFSIASRLLRD
jgi:hypothetical protein